MPGRPCCSFFDLFLDRLEDLGEVEVGGGELGALHLESTLLEGRDHVGLFVQIRTRSLGRARGQRPQLLEGSIVECVGREGDDEALLGNGAEVPHLMRRFATSAVSAFSGQHGHNGSGYERKR